MAASVNFHSQTAPPGTLARVKVGEAVLTSFDADTLSPEAAQAQDEAFTRDLTALIRAAGYPAHADPAQINTGMVMLLVFVPVFCLTMAYGPVAAMLGGLLLNARHLPFGLAVSDLLAGGWLRRLVGSHLMVDEAVAFALAQPDRPRRRAAYWATGASIFVLWQAGTVAGVYLGGAVGDPARYGLDAAFPAALVALLLPRLREPAGLRVGLVAAVVAVAASFFVSPGLPVLLGLAGLLVAGRSSKSTVEPALEEVR